MEHKNFQFKLKAPPDDTGAFSGLASTYGNQDRGGDIVASGAFNQSIQMQGRGYPILWQHRADEPIGMGRVSDSPKGLQIDGQLVLEDPTAQKAHAFMKAGIVKGLSIGFETIKSTTTPDGGRLLQEVKLWEVSVVTFPMNDLASVTSVKSLSDAARLMKDLPSDGLDAETIATLMQIDLELKRLGMGPSTPTKDDSALRELKAFAKEIALLVG